MEIDARGRVIAHRLTRLGELIVAQHAMEPDSGQVRAALLDKVRREGLAVLAPAESLRRWQARLAFLRSLDPPSWPDASDAALLESVDDWLGPLLDGRVSLAQVAAAQIDAAIRALLPWDRQRELDRLAPERLVTPAGPAHAIDYTAEGGPRVDVRVQELYGLRLHPSVAGVPLTLALLSPAHRPVALTRDLPAFWRGAWAEVRTEMRGRYPKHPWPEDPAAAPPTTRAKPRGT